MAVGLVVLVLPLALWPLISFVLSLDWVYGVVSLNFLVVVAWWGRLSLHRCSHTFLSTGYCWQGLASWWFQLLLLECSRLPFGRRAGWDVVWGVYLYEWISGGRWSKFIYLFSFNIDAFALHFFSCWKWTHFFKQNCATTAFYYC